MSKKVSRNMYDASRVAYNAARLTNDLEDIASGNLKKMVKRHIKRNIRGKANKVLDNVFRSIGF